MSWRGVGRCRRFLNSIRREFLLLRSLVWVVHRAVGMARRLLKVKKDVSLCINQGWLHLKAGTEQINWRRGVFLAGSAWSVPCQGCGNECRTGLVTVVADWLTQRE